MKERPILFNGEMVRAVLGGRKTQTRRVIKPQPPEGWGGTSNVFALSTHCPYGAPGDRLWVRECFGYDPFFKINGHKKLLYRATQNIDADYPIKWRPSIHMPRWASRISLEITDVRVERLQDITRGDIRAEGVTIPPHMSNDERYNWRAYRDAWVRIWDSINVKRGYGWGVNPWVWVVEFRAETTR